MNSFLRSARSHLLRAALVPALVLGVAACDDDDGTGPEIIGETIVDIAANTTDVSTLVTALVNAELDDDLNGAGPFTVFAPINSAFEALPAGELDRLLDPANFDELVELLQYHVIAGEALLASDLTAGELTTLSGDAITIATDGGVTVNGVSVITADIEGSNGVIHLIGEVLLPPRPAIPGVAAGAPDLSTLVAALGAAELVEALEAEGPFTVFAPLNSAFDELGADVIEALLQEGNIDVLSRVLTFHVVAGAGVYAGELTDGQTFTTLEGEDLTIGVDGGAVTVNGANVIAANVRASNGIVHIIDEVLVPSPLNIVETAVLTSGTTTLAAAVNAAELSDALQGDNMGNGFTVFAPVNSAFADLGEYTLNQLLAEENIALLQEILTYHVVPGTVLAGDLMDGMTAETLEGRELTFDLSDAMDPRVNGVSITATDIVVENGVIHLVDEVIVPELDIVETAAITEGFSTLVAAVGAAELTETLKSSNEGAGFTVFAPTDAAFEALGMTVENLIANPDILADVLTYHVLSGTVLSGALQDGLSVPTVEGGNVTFTADMESPSGFMINDANITAVDIEAENGAIHVIDAVLLESMNIVQRATVTDGTGTLAEAVVAGDLDGTLAGGEFTVFAPIDAAFEALGAYTLEQLLAEGNIALLQEILTYHVVPGSVFAGDLTDGGTATTVEGRDLTFDLSGETPQVNGVNIIATDIVTENGVIHLVDGVIVPELDIVETAIITEGFSTLVAAVTEAELVATLKSDNGGAGFTVFAPTNDAFAALGMTVDNLLENPGILADVLTYHVLGSTVLSGALQDGLSVPTVEGGDVTFTADMESPSGFMINDANITAVDIEAENGAIHVIDAVLLESLNIVERATVTDGTGTLATAVAATSGATTDVAAILSGEGPFTVFAPVDAAFEALGTDRIEVLLDPANVDLLSNVLAYHAVAGAVFAADLTDGQVVTTLSTDDVTIDLSGETPMVNGANIIATDIVTENGVIHLIDAVLTENLDLVEVATVEGFSTLVELVAQQGLAPTLQGDGPSGMGLTVFAPTNAAFEALQSVPQGQALTDVLTYHVVDGTIGSGDLTDGQMVSPLGPQGAMFTVNIDGSVTITDGAGNTVNVTVTDVAAANGVIHVVDAVLLPGS